jgi:flagellar assembly protein FliH
MPQTESKARGAAGKVETFQYPASASTLPPFAWDAWSASNEEDSEEEPPVPTISHEEVKGAVEAQLRPEFEKKLAEETRKAFEAGRERGRLEGRQTEREAQAAEQTAAEERRMRQAAELVERFALERDRYLHAIEHEVVELALAVSARILRREAQMDPLLLTGAVRVALGQLSGSTQVRLLVPAGELDLWCEAIALLPNLSLKPNVIAGENMRLGDCRIETEMGSVDIGIRAQLSEIERGFFDRAGGRRSTDRVPATEPNRVGREVHS